MKIARYSKAQVENFRWFQEEVGRRLVEIGASQDNVPLYYKFCLNTFIGQLLITPHDDGWIACRWLDVPAAREALGSGMRLNPISGKWNFLYDAAMFKARASTERIAEDFIQTIFWYLTSLPK